MTAFFFFDVSQLAVELVEVYQRKVFPFNPSPGPSPVDSRLSTPVPDPMGLGTVGMEMGLFWGHFFCHGLVVTHFVEESHDLLHGSIMGLDQWVVDLRVFWMLGVDPLVKKMIRHFSDVRSFWAGQMPLYHADHTVIPH